jgi:hypothetical protein
MYRTTYEPEIRPAADVTSVAELPSVTLYVMGAFCKLGDGWHTDERVVARTERLLREMRDGVDYDNSELWFWALDVLSERGYLERQGEEYRLAFDRERVRRLLLTEWEMGRYLDR